MNPDTKQDARFQGDVPRLYDKHLGPVVFVPYAYDIAQRVNRLKPQAVLEIACGTGIVTRCLRRALPVSTQLMATDLNQAMVDCAKCNLADEKAIEWRQADACALPFDAAAFDALVCQFGYMFLPDKALGFREARRVLKPDGTLLFNVWGSTRDNPYWRIATDTILGFFGDEPPTFYQVPFGFHDETVIHSLLSAAGFGEIVMERVTLKLESESARHFAIGLVKGTPGSFAITERGLDADEIMEAVTVALTKAGGAKPFRSTMQALVVSARG